MLTNESIFDYFENRVLYFSDRADFCKLSKSQSGPLRIAIDSESCMSRLTGGCHPDWQSGGQWNHLSYFYSDLKRSCAQNSIEIIIFFNGTAENFDSWKKKQIEIRKKAERIFSSEGSPRMSNWIEPSFSKQSIISEINQDLFGELKTRSMFCYSTFGDHKKEIVQYLIENKCDALLTNDFELIALILAFKENQENLTKLKFYSGQKFKLSSKKEISSFTYDFDIALKLFNLTVQKMILLSILINIGQLNINSLNKNLKTQSKLESEDKNFIVIKNIVDYVKNLKEPFDIDSVVIEIFEFSVDTVNKIKETILDKNQWFNSIELHETNTWARTKADLNNNEYFKMINLRFLNGNNSNSSMETECESEITLPDDFDFKLKQLHVNCIISPLLVKLLRKREMFLPTLLEKECGEFPKADDIYQDIRLNCYKVLFSGLEGVHVSEYFLSANERTVDQRIVDVNPCYKKMKIDKIWALGGKARKILWFNCIGSSFEQGSRDIFKTSFDMFIPCLILKFLIKKKLLNDRDIKAFIYTFDKLRISRKELFEKNRNLRATNLASIFLRGIEMFDFVNHVTGNPFKTRYFKIKNFFDGNVFQMMYEKVYSDNSDLTYKSDCLNVNHMYHFVTKDLDVVPSPKKSNKVSQEPKARVNFVGRGRPIQSQLQKSNEPRMPIETKNLQSDSDSSDEERHVRRHSSPHWKYLIRENLNESREKITLEYLLLNNN